MVCEVLEMNWREWNARQKRRNCFTQCFMMKKSQMGFSSVHKAYHGSGNYTTGKQQGLIKYFQ